MALDFNVSPYNDDFDPTKEFYRILFQPGRAVQARELTQMQTILGNQINNFAQNIFSNGSVVSGGQHQLDDSAFYLQVLPTYNNGTTTVNVDFSSIAGQYIVEASTGKLGYVKKFTPATGTDLPTLHVSIIVGPQTPFNNNSNFYALSENNPTATPVNYFTSAGTTSSPASGTSLLFHIGQGVFYTNNTFCYCPEQTIVVGKYSKTPSAVIGLNVVETVVDYIDDSSLLDPALGSSNYLAPGADRYKIDLQLTTQPYNLPAVSYSNFIQLTTVVNGAIVTDQSTPIYSTIMDTMAKRTYDTNGNFIVKSFLPILKDDAQDTSKLILDISAGSAFVQGYEIETQSTTTLSLDKARTTATETGYGIATVYGNYTYVNTLFGSLPEINTTTVVEIHNVTTGQTADSKIGTVLIRSLEYVEGFSTNAVYALFLDDINLTATSFASARSFYTGTYGVSTTFSAIIDGSAINGLNAQIFDSAYNTLVFNLPRNYVQSLANVGYFYKEFFTGTVSGNTVNFALTHTSDELIAASTPTAILENYTVVDTTTGNFIPLDDVTITLSGSPTYQGVINFGTNAYSGHGVNIIVTAKTSNDTYRQKTLVSQHVGGVLTAANTASYDLLKSDVHSLDFVYEFPTTSTYKGVWASSTSYSNGDVVIDANNIGYISTSGGNVGNVPSGLISWTVLPNSKSYYSFNTGQTDGYYDHGSIARTSSPASTIQALPIFSYFTHSGYGYLTPQSYPIDYGLIPNYTSSTGVIYSLNDCIDFRPRRTDDTTDFVLSQHQIPQALSNINVYADITYYLGRIDRIVLTRDGQFKDLTGVPAYLNPQPPVSQSDSIDLFVLNYLPYTTTAADVNVQVIPHKRYTMKDISSLDNRITNIEYYTSLNSLESQTNAKTITNANGTTLFKNGYIVDTFNGSGVGDVTNPEYRASIDYTNGFARPLYLADNIGLTYRHDLSTTAFGNTGFSSLVTVPYTSNVFVNQPIASEAISVNPFSVVNFAGTMRLSPESDVWFDTNVPPVIITNTSGGNDNYATYSGVETQWNAWQAIWTGETITDSSISTSSTTSGSIVTSQVATQSSVTVSSSTQIINPPPGLVSGTSITSVSRSVLPWARDTIISFQLDGMAANTPLYLYINNINMTQCLHSDAAYSNTGITFLNSGITTDPSGRASGFIAFPGQRFLAGNQNIVICDNFHDVAQSTSYAQATFFSEGLLDTLSSPIISTKPNSSTTNLLNVNQSSLTVNQVGTTVLQTANTAINKVIAPNPTFALTSDYSSIVEGETINFVLSTTNVPPGTTFNANISGTIVNSDISGGGFSLGNTTITTVGTTAIGQAVLSVPVSGSAITGSQIKYIQLEVDVPASISLGSALSYFSNVSIQSSTVPTFFAQANSYVVTGNTAYITFSASDLLSDQTIYYSTTGTANTDTGSFTINAPSGSQTLSYHIPPNYTIVGNDVLDVQFTWGAGNTNVKTTSTSIASNTTFALNAFNTTLSANTSDVNAGQSFSINLNSIGVSSGTLIPYTITGVSTSDLNGASLTGNFSVAANGKASAIFTTNTNISTAETFKLTLTGKTPVVQLPINITAATPINITAPSNVQVGTPFNFVISNGPINGFWSATSNYGDVISNQPLNSSGASTYTVSSGLASPVNYTWSFTFNDGRTNSVQMTGRAVPVAPPSFTLSGPTEVNSGGSVWFILSSSGQSNSISVPFTISNPNGNYISVYGGINVTFNDSGAPDYASYVNNYADLIEAYTDALNAYNGQVTTLYAQSNNGIFKNAQDEYNTLIGGKSVWSTYAAQGISAFGQYHWTTFGKSEGRILPITSQISGTYIISDSNQGNLTLTVNGEVMSNPFSTITMTVGGAVNQTRTVKINNTKNSLLPALNPTTQKIVGTGDFVDSNLTIAQALGANIFYIDGLNYEQALATPGAQGKIWLSSSQATAANTYGNLVASWYRAPTGLNRNPDLGGFLYWVNSIFITQNNQAVTSPLVYPVSAINTGFNSLAQNYAVWVSNQQSAPYTPQTIYRNWTVNTTGTYTLSLAADDICKVYLNSGEIVSYDGVYPWNPVTVSVQVSSGPQVLTFVAQNLEQFGQDWSINPGWWAATITDSSGNVVWDTRSHAASETVELFIPGNLTEAQAIAIVQSIVQNAAIADGEGWGARAQFLACTTDPLSQTFFVAEGVYPNGVFLTGVDLFFQNKDSNIPVFVEIRPTVNGYPSSDQVIPLSTVWKSPYAVNTSTDASVATHFEFTDPVYLPAGEYALVVGSNSSSYKCFVGTIGQQQIGTTNTITGQPNVGSLFESQNASTWTADQNSDLCFVLYKANFDTSTSHQATFHSNIPDRVFEFELVDITTQELDFNNTTSVTYEITNSFDGTPDAEPTLLLANQNFNLPATRNVVNAGDTVVTSTLTTTDPNVSPVIDTDRMSVILINNLVNNSTAVTIPETSSVGGNAYAKYVTRSVTLSSGFDATGITVYFDLNMQVDSSVEVYVKVLAADDNDTLQNKTWQLVPPTSAITQYSTSYSDWMPAQEYQLENISYVSGGVTYSNFQTFAVKVVMYSSNPAIVPQIKNFGAIATS